jgi:hypothetical protein
MSIKLQRPATPAGTDAGNVEAQPIASRITRPTHPNRADTG